MKKIALGWRDRRTNLQLAQEAMRRSAHDDKRITKYKEREKDQVPDCLVASFICAEDFLEGDPKSWVNIDISWVQGLFSARIYTNAEF